MRSENQIMRTLLIGSAAAVSVLALGGCPTTQQLDYIAGSTGDATRLGTTASVSVLAPATNLAIAGGAPVEVNWGVVATTNFAEVQVIFDPDTDPENGNEIVASDGLTIRTTSALLDTSALTAGSYNVGVLLFEANSLAAFDYANGRIVVNQRAQLFFNSPRDNFVFDRTVDVTPRFDVDWTLRDPDSTVITRVFLDPDATPNGNELPLRESSSQTGDRFTFNLPTSQFDAGTYRIVAIVDDGVAQVAVYAPGTIRLRSRLAGLIDLRDLDRPDAIVQGAVFEGFNPRDNAGSFVGSARDIDGDGFADFIIMSQFGKPLYQSNVQRTGVGEAYLIYGRGTRFSGAINLNSTGTLFRGEIIGGPAEAPDPIRPSRGITSFTVCADWDGDTVRELAFGTPFTDSLGINPMDANGWFRTGGAVVMAGSALRPDLGFPGGNVMELSEFGMLPFGPTSDQPCPEGLVGPKAPLGLGGSGSTSYWRHRQGDPAQPNPGSVRLGCRFGSNEFNDQFGETVSAWHFDSLIMSAPNRDPGITSVRVATQGQSFLGAGVISVFFNVTANGFYPWRGTNAPPANAQFNYPGTPDVAVNPDLLPHHGPFAYVLNDTRTFGGDPASPGYVVDPDDAEMPCTRQSHGSMSSVLQLYGVDAGGRLGNAVAVDDLNGDGLDDVLLGNPFGASAAGECFILFGRLRNLVAPTELSMNELRLPLNAGGAVFPRIFDGIRVVGAPGERLGTTQDRVGDFNGDGLPDVVIGSPLLNNRRGGAVVFFGSRDTINATDMDIAFNDIAPRGLGVTFVGDVEGDLVGARVAGVGDIDGDGLGDILIAAPEKSVRADPDLDGTLEIDRTQCGVVYLIYGSSKLSGVINLTDVGTEKLPGAVFVGRASGDQLGAGIGEQGDRSFGIATPGDVDGDGRRDLLLGSVSASPRTRVRAGEAYVIYGLGD